MSKRHHSSRRRAYGRRQHELRERTDRHQPIAADDRSAAAEDERDRFGFLDLDLAGRRLSFAVGD